MSKENGSIPGPQLDLGTASLPIPSDPLSRAQHLAYKGIRPSGKDLRDILRNSLLKPEDDDLRDSLLRRAAGSDEFPILTGWRSFRIGRWFPFASKYPVMVRENPVNKNSQDQEIEFWKLRALHQKKQVGAVKTAEVKPGEFDEGNIIPIANGGSRFLDWLRSVRKTPYASVVVSEGLPYIGTPQKRGEELSPYAPIPVSESFQKQTEPTPEAPRKESAVKSNARKALQKAFKLHIKAERHARKQPELYKVTRDETREAIANMDSKIIHAAAEGISDESLLTNTATNRRLRNLFKFTKQQIMELGQEDKDRLKAAKITLTSIARSKAAYKARERKQIRDDNRIDWIDSEVALGLVDGILGAGSVEDIDPFRNEYETAVNPDDYRGDSGSADTGGANGYNGRTNGTYGPAAGPHGNGTGRGVASLEPARLPIILNARGLPSPNPVFQERVTPIANASARAAVGIMERPAQEAEIAGGADTTLESMLRLVQMSTVDHMPVAGMHGENGQAQVVPSEATGNKHLSLRDIVKELEDYGKAQIVSNEGDKLHAVIDYSDPIVKAALSEVDWDNFSVELKKGGRELVVRDLVPA